MYFCVVSDYAGKESLSKGFEIQKKIEGGGGVAWHLLKTLSFNSEKMPYIATLWNY